MTFRSRNRPVVSDPEVLEMLADRPELLAIADAVSATRPRVNIRRREPLRQPFSWKPLAGWTAVVAAAALLATLLPLRGGVGGLADEALAAVSTGQTLHVVMDAPSKGDSIIDLKTGRTVRPKVRLEVWFDEANDRMRLQVRKNGALQYTGASMYPLGSGMRATLAADGASPSLGVFVAGYRDALKAGQVRELSHGMYAGHQVAWLRVGVGAAAHTVAVDEQTKLPVLVKTATGDDWRLEQVDSEQSPVPSSGAADIDVSPVRMLAVAATPATKPHPVSGKVVSSRWVPVAAAQIALRGKLTAPPRVGELTLARVSVQTLSTTFSDGHTDKSIGVALHYSTGKQTVRVQEAMEPQPAYKFVEPDRTYNFDPLPANGQMVLEQGMSGPARWTGQMRLPDGLYLTLVGPSDKLLIALARALALS